MRARFALAAVVAAHLASQAFGQATVTAPRPPLAEQPLRMAKDIEAFEAHDKLHPPPKHAVLLSGASSLRMWKDVDKVLAPLPVINRGFGGAYTTEVLGYMDRITLPYEPRVVVFHGGGNDINAGDPPDAPLGRIRTYVERLREKNPDTAIVLLTAALAPSRRTKWPRLAEFNRGLAAYAKELTNASLVDINAVINLPDGEPRPGYYLPDDLHPSQTGYIAIAELLKPAVDAAWTATAEAFRDKPTR